WSSMQHVHTLTLSLSLSFTHSHTHTHTHTLQPAAHTRVLPVCPAHPVHRSLQGRPLWTAVGNMQHNAHRDLCTVRVGNKINTYFCKCLCFSFFLAVSFSDI